MDGSVYQATINVVFPLYVRINSISYIQNNSCTNSSSCEDSLKPWDGYSNTINQDGQNRQQSENQQWRYRTFTQVTNSQEESKNEQWTNTIPNRYKQTIKRTHQLDDACTHTQIHRIITRTSQALYLQRSL